MEEDKNRAEQGRVLLQPLHEGRNPTPLVSHPQHPEGGVGERGLQILETGVLNNRILFLITVEARSFDGELKS